MSLGPDNKDDTVDSFMSKPVRGKKIIIIIRINLTFTEKTL